MAKLIEITGKALSGEWGLEDESRTGIPVLRTTNFTNLGIINYGNVVTRNITKKNISEKFLRKGDIIIEKSGGSDKQPVGRVVLFNGEENRFLFNNFTGVLRVKDREKWVPDYVFYALFANYRNGGTRKYENKTTGLHNLKTDLYINNYEIEWINIAEQKNVCATLRKIESIISDMNKEIDYLDELIKARFVEMFKDCIESVKLEQVVTSIKTGKLDANAEKKDGKYPFFTCDATPKRIDDYVFDTEAILISGNGSRVGHVHYYKGKFNAYQRTYVLSDFRHDVDLSYLKTYLENELRPYIARNKKGSAVPYITLPMLQNFKLPFPPLEKQKEFATFVAQIDKSKFAVQKSLEKTQLLFDSLMQEYFG